MTTLTYRGHSYEKITKGVYMLTCGCGCEFVAEMKYKQDDEGAEAELINILDMTEDLGKDQCIGEFLIGIAEGGDADKS